MTVLRQEYRDGMARLGAAANIITTEGPAGRSGMTASAAVSVTDDPPTLAVSINRSSRKQRDHEDQRRLGGQHALLRPA
jgi:flavin reductase